MINQLTRTATMSQADRRPSILHTATSPLRWAMFVAGWACVGLGIVGLIVPAMPGTVFLILAAWLFSRSSPRFEAWLLNHRYLGPSVMAWRERGAVPRWAQLVATASMALSFSILVFLGFSVPLLALLAILFVAISAYLLTRPTA